MSAPGACRNQPASLVCAGIGIASMQGLARAEVSVAVTVRTATPARAGSCWGTAGARIGKIASNSPSPRAATPVWEEPRWRFGADASAAGCVRRPCARGRANRSLLAKPRWHGFGAGVAHSSVASPSAVAGSRAATHHGRRAKAVPTLSSVAAKGRGGPWHWKGQHG